MAVCKNPDCKVATAYGSARESAKLPCSVEIEAYTSDIHRGSILESVLAVKPRDKATLRDVINNNIRLRQQGHRAPHPDFSRAVLRVSCASCGQTIRDVLPESSEEAFCSEIGPFYCNDVASLGVLYDPKHITEKGNPVPKDARTLCEVSARFAATELLTPRVTKSIQRSLQIGQPMQNKLETKSAAAQRRFGDNRKTCLSVGLGWKGFGHLTGVLKVWPVGFSSPRFHHGGIAGCIRVLVGALSIQVFKDLFAEKPLHWQNPVHFFDDCVARRNDDLV
eukprot:CAMPEP_0206608430 /NCGR_PEP_ID=MMETSP0325_2-20121206/52999_1 /ASSEMBLY_ACC=CAM_ASM_000347 /TAXON_ID=2866 /ORGANISM="Crypthecodinium cohnii, Strain Seligo" /LENGTH=278 /DNA_ID=CAMNT_0054126149 /DNA_START=103 /DNA_END=939 /DNA_ORIENTATION=-